MSSKAEEIAGLFLQAGKAHHQAFIETDGDDPEWPLWYADYLLDKLPPLLGTKMTKSELVYWVLHLSKIQPVQAPDTPWSQFYANYLLNEFK